MLKNSIANTFTDIEDILISRVNKTIDVIINFFNYSG